MVYLPQLNSGAAAQLPLRWSDRFGYITNLLADGSMIVLADAGAAALTWELSYDGLDESERSALQAFFECVCGSLKPFTMVDPADNLLTFSEDFSQACWAPGPLLQMTTGGVGPFGATPATTLTNTAQAVQGIGQQINAPGTYRYCLSVYIRSEIPQTVWLTQSSSGAVIQEPFVTSARWQRAVLSGTPGVGEVVSFGVELPSGAQVQLFGAQAEAQPVAGTYKRTLARAGVYEHCRFAHDELQMTATQFGAYRCALRITSAGQISW